MLNPLVVPRGNMYSVMDDKMLCKAWLATSLDPVNGCYNHWYIWGRISEMFNANSIYYRNEASLRHRWHYIVSEINKFARCYAQMGSVSSMWLLNIAPSYLTMWYPTCFISLITNSINLHRWKMSSHCTMCLGEGRRIRSGISSIVGTYSRKVRS